MSQQILKPAGWPRPSGYSNGVAAAGRQIFLAGQIGWDAQGRFPSARLADQVRQALQNICAVLAEAGAGPEHLVRLTWFVTSRDEYHADLEGIGAAYRAVMGKNFPAMSVVQVVALMESQAKVEIEATAVIPVPDDSSSSSASATSSARTSPR
ncbi:MAG TPA: RidA family protein [Steroidobacteraceae bacterium]|nr:RidA family protein [Steroidobacteraceae bacterium]